MILGTARRSRALLQFVSMASTVVHYGTVAVFVPKFMMLSLQNGFIVSVIPSDPVKKERVQMKYQEVIGHTRCCWSAAALMAQKAVCKFVAGALCPSVCPGLVRGFPLFAGEVKKSEEF